ncbi:MAG: hypothetical protein AAGF46_11885, partial [Pseudomonadota bacterium]
MRLWQATFQCLVLTGLLSAAGVASAQETDDIEPGVDTSAPEASAGAEDIESVEPRVTVSAERPVSSQSRALDSLTLGTSQITGNQELPQVLYIVPWKSSDLGDLVGRPVNTLLDEVLAPADR